MKIVITSCKWMYWTYTVVPAVIRSLPSKISTTPVIRSFPSKISTTSVIRTLPSKISTTPVIRSLPSKISTTSVQTWGQLHSNVIDYITITLQFS